MEVTGVQPAPEAHDGMRKRGQVAPDDDGVVADDREHRGPTAESPEEVAERAQKEKRKGAGCCMRFLSSRFFKMLTFVVIAATPVFGLAVSLPVLLEKRGCTDWFCILRHYCLGLFLAIQFMYNFAMTQWTDPGSCRKIQPTYEMLGQFELCLEPEAPSEKRRLLSGSSDAPGSANATQAEVEDQTSNVTILYAPNFCELCQHWKPPRSHHCTFCKRCVLRMDHHCPFTGNCIGAHNHGHFLLMYFFAAVGLIYVLTLCFLVIKSDHNGAFTGMWRRAGFFGPGIAGFLMSFSQAVIIAAGLEVAIQTMASLVALLAVLSFGIPAIYLASRGSTIIENNFPMKEFVQIQPQIYCPLGPGFYRQRWHVNLLQLLGPWWHLRLLLPTHGILDPSVSVAPRPSKDGVAALLERVEQVRREGVLHEVRSCRDIGINPGPLSTDSGAVV